jgi:ribosomal protein S18 acetylase RimI-like enzyme
VRIRVRKLGMITRPLAAMMDVMNIRTASADDRGFLEQMLAVAADWRPGSPVRPVDQLLSDPHLAHYVDGWPRSGDFGVIAEDRHGRPFGAAWCTHLPADDPGYGFVAATVPEISIGVVAEARGRGIGRALMSGLIDHARDRGVAQLSLSVEIDNPAIDLYTRAGFTVAAESDGAATMVLDVVG